MNETPRTQAMRLNVDYALNQLHYINSEDGPLVPASFAMLLECALNELNLKYMDQSSQVLELMKDKARLDWMETQEVVVSTALDGLDLFGFNPAFNDTPPNIRDLIDTQMEADK